MTAYKNIFLDTAPVTYYLEENAQFFDAVTGFMNRYAEAHFHTSVITLMEYSVMPYRNSNQKQVDDLYAFLNDAEVNIATINQTIADTAAKIRAKYIAFKGLDSIQLATAKELGCDAFLTNDKQLKQYTELSVVLATDLTL